MRKKIGCRRPVNLFPCSPALICDTWMIKHPMRCFLSRSLAPSLGLLVVFCLIKSRSTATSYRKKKASVYNTSKRTPPPYKQRTQTNTPNKTLHHHKLGDEAKEAAANYAVVANAVPRRNRGPLQARAVTRTPPPSDYHPQAAHTRSSIPLFQWCFSRTLPSQRT